MGALLQGPPFTLLTSDGVLQGGDSLSSLDTHTQMPMLVKRRFMTACQRVGAQARWWNHAVSNTSLAAELLRVQTSLSRYPITKYIAILGTAPVLLGNTVGTVNDTTNATILGAFRLILDATAGSGIPAYIATVALVGEKTPDGANGAGDATINSVIAGMAVIAARYPLCTFRDLRAAIYTALEAGLNTTNATIGPLTQPDGVAAHPNQGGRGRWDSVISGDIGIAQGGGQSIALTPYSGIILPNQGSLGLLYDSDRYAAVGDGNNITAAPNAGLVGSLMDLNTTPATKPIFRLSASGKPWSAIEFGGATWMRSAVLAANQIKAQPMMTVFIWRPATLTTQILYDGTVGTQEASLAQIVTTNVVEPNAGSPFDSLQTIAATTWHVSIVFWAGNRASSYQVLNGTQFPLGDMGGNFTRTQLTIGANSGNALPMNGQMNIFGEYYASLGSLPRWQDVYGSIVAKRGAFPQV